MSIIPSITVPDDRTVKMPLRTLVIVIGFIAAGCASWVLLRYQVEQQGEAIAAHSKALEVLGNKLDADHDLLIGISADLKALTREQANAPAR